MARQVSKQQCYCTNPPTTQHTGLRQMSPSLHCPNSTALHKPCAPTEGRSWCSNQRKSVGCPWQQSISWDTPAAGGRGQKCSGEPGKQSMRQALQAMQVSSPCPQTARVGGKPWRRIAKTAESKPAPIAAATPCAIPSGRAPTCKAAKGGDAERAVAAVLRKVLAPKLNLVV